MSRHLPALLLLALCACGSDEDRQPTAAEVRQYTARIDRAEAEAKAAAVRESRAEEKSRADQHQARVPAQD